MLERTISTLRSIYAEKALAVLDAARPRDEVGSAAREVGRKWLFDRIWPTLRDLRPCRDYVTTINGVRIAGNTKDTIPAILYYLGVVEDNLTYWFDEQLRDGDIFVDVGAHIGYFTLLEAKRVGASGGVVAIEASPTMFSSLVHNIELNPDLKPRIRALNICALDTDGTVELFEGPEHHTGGSSVRPRPLAKSPVRVPAMRLADVLTPEEVARMRLMKIDVEGAEFETVAGLLPVLHLTRPDFEIVVETSPDWQYAGRVARVEDMIQLFAQHGFYAYGLKKQPYVSRRWHAKPVRIERDPNWGTFDLVFARRNQTSI